MPPFRARMDMGAIAMHSPKFQHHCNLTIRLFSVISRTLVECGGGSYSSAEKQSVYSTAPADWTIFNLS